MKIGIIMPLAEQRGGAEQLLLDLVTHGLDLDIQWVLIFLESGSMTNQVKALGVETYIVSSGRLRDIHQWGQAVIQIARIAKKTRCNVLVGWMWKAHLYSGPASILAGIPSVWYQHEAPDDLSLLKRIANWIPTTAVLVITKACQEAQLKNFPKTLTRVVYPGADLDRFNPTALSSVKDIRVSLDLPLQVPIVGIVGRLQHWKGIHVLIEAMPTILQFYPDVQCVVVGGKHDLEIDYFDYLKDLIAKLHLEQNVILAGFQRNIPEWMQAMDVIVHASDQEPFGIVVVEAMALGKPVVAGASGGPTEIISPGIDGLLVPFNEADLLADAVLRCLKDQDFANQLGSAAQVRAQDFSIKKFAGNFINTVEDILSKSTHLQENV